MTDNGSLLRNVQVTEFALIEAGLFLDTHPGDENALEYFCQYKKLYEQAVAAYNAAVGPLDFMQNDCTRWKWTDGPFPWERAANV